jgi:hypothetical protein
LANLPNGREEALKKKARRVYEFLHRAKGWDSLLSLLLNSHIAEFFLAVLGYE